MSRLPVIKHFNCGLITPCKQNLAKLDAWVHLEINYSTILRMIKMNLVVLTGCPQEIANLWVKKEITESENNNTSLLLSCNLQFFIL